MPVTSLCHTPVTASAPGHPCNGLVTLECACQQFVKTQQNKKDLGMFTRMFRSGGRCNATFPPTGSGSLKLQMDDCEGASVENRTFACDRCGGERRGKSRL